MFFFIFVLFVTCFSYLTVFFAIITLHYTTQLLQTMSHKIKYLSLQKPKLLYEVSIRGCTPADNVQELRKQVEKLSQTIPSEDILEAGLDFDDDS